MARISGIDLPKQKQGEIGLTYIYGIGRSTAQKILSQAGVDFHKKVQDWTDEEQNKIRTIITDSIKVEGALRSETQMNIKRLMDIGSYRGIRHRLVFRHADRARRIMPVPVREGKRQSPTRKRQLRVNRCFFVIVLKQNVVRISYGKI